MNTYEITYQVPRSGAGTVRETIAAASEQDARALVRAKFAGREVQIVGGRMTDFGGGGRDQRYDGRR